MAAIVKNKPLYLKAEGRYWQVYMGGLPSIAHLEIKGRPCESIIMTTEEMDDLILALQAYRKET